MGHQLLVLGAGTAGTMVVNKLRRLLDPEEWAITVVDRDDEHHYQPGYLMVPFGSMAPEAVVRSRHAQLSDGVRFITAEVDRVDTDADEVLLADGTRLHYDQLVIASGTTPRPDQTPGMDGSLWRESVHEFYTLEGAVALRHALERFDGGRLVVHVDRDADQVPGRPAGVHLPGRELAARARTARPGRDRLRDPAVGCLHQARRVAPSRSPARRAQGARRARLHGRAHRRGRSTRWCRSTSARCPSTCWSPCRSTWAPTSWPARASATSSTTCRSTARRSWPPGTQRLRHRRRQQHPDVQGRLGRPLLRRRLRRELPRPRRGSAADPPLRRARQLLRRERRRQGAADRLQLRRRAAAGQVPAAVRRPDDAARREPRQPLRQAGLPLGLLERPAPRPAAAAPAAMSMAGKSIPPETRTTGEDA